MGAWDEGNFGNDNALDFLGDLVIDGKNKILSAIQIITATPQSEYVESSDCCVALAAIEFIAAAKGKPAEDFPKEGAEWLSQNNLLPYEEIDIIALSQQAIDRIKNNSELKELWEATKDFTKWLEVLTGLEKRLS